MIVKILKWLVWPDSGRRAFKRARREGDGVPTLIPRAFGLRVVDAPPADGPRHKFGGLPHGLSDDNAPRCVNCPHPLHLLLQVDLSDPQLGVSIPGLSFLHVLACLNSRGSYSTEYRAIRESPAIENLGQIEEQTSRDYPDVLPERRVELVPLAGPQPDEDDKRHQLGGTPFWVQSSYSPACRTCGKPMKVFAAIDTDDTLAISFGDMGMLYAYVCPECFVLATTAQYY